MQHGLQFSQGTKCETQLLWERSEMAMNSRWLSRSSLGKQLLFCWGTFSSMGSVCRETITPLQWKLGLLADSLQLFLLLVPAILSHCHLPSHTSLWAFSRWLLGGVPTHIIRHGSTGPVRSFGQRFSAAEKGCRSNSVSLLCAQTCGHSVSPQAGCGSPGLWSQNWEVEAGSSRVQG